MLYGEWYIHSLYAGNFESMMSLMGFGGLVNDIPHTQLFLTVWDSCPWDPGKVHRLSSCTASECGWVGT